MAKFRKKPVVIEAIQYRGPMMYGLICDFVGSELKITNDGVVINTLEGDMIARFGDYIIKGVKGEFYPCKPDIFEESYETVEDEPSEERWNAAIENARFMIEEYKKIPSGIFGATTIAQTIERYDKGERTKELLEQLESIE